jgi:hypothetical protein
MQEQFSEDFVRTGSSRVQRNYILYVALTSQQSQTAHMPVLIMKPESALSRNKGMMSSRIRDRGMH